MQPPRLMGRTLTAVRIAAKIPGLEFVIREVVRRSLGLDKLPGLPEAWRGSIPLDARPIQAAAPRRWGDADLGPLPVRAWPRPSAAYTAAYQKLALTPRSVAERALSE